MMQPQPAAPPPPGAAAQQPHNNKQLELCRALQQAVIACQQQVASLVPRAFNAALLDALQQLIDAAQQQLQEEQLQSVRACLEAALQLLARVASLGAVEAFFCADELLAHYQWRLDATHAVLSRLTGSKISTALKGSALPGAAPGAPCKPGEGHQQQQQDATHTCPCRLQLPEQQQRIVQSFRQQAANLCPMLAQSCPPAALQQLCDTVKQGLLLVNGHSFLLGQGWQCEVAAMLARAEQLKVLLAHWPAHHLSLLASVLQHLQQQEEQQYDLPRSRSCSSSPSKRPTTPAMLMLQQEEEGDERQGQQRQQPVVPAGFREAAGDGRPAADEDDDDDFFLPVAPIGPASGSPASGSSPGAAAGAAAKCLLPLPCHLLAPAAQPAHSSARSDGDSIARTPSSGCSSLQEFVQHSRASVTAAAAAAAVSSASGGSPPAANALHEQQQRQWLCSVEQQLLSIAGPEVAAVLAAALGYEQVPCSSDSRSSSFCAVGSSAGSAPDLGRHALAGALPAITGLRQSSVGSGGNISVASSPDHSRPGSLSMLARLSSSAAGLLMLQERSSSSGGPAGPGSQKQQKKKQKRRWRWRLRRPEQQQPSRALCLQHVQLPPGCCRSIGAVCCLCPHLQRLVLVGVGLTDEALGDLVDALKVSRASSIQHLDLSCNALEDIGARVLAANLLRPHTAGRSSGLRTLCLQHNRIGDDGAAALARGLTSSRLQRLWLHHNAVGVAGAQALCRALQQHNQHHHSTSCTELQLHPGNEGVPVQLAQLAQQLARQNRGVRDHITALLKAVVGDGGSGRER